MSSGTKRLIVNTRERAVSNDLNRLQTFKDADLAELLRLMVGVTGYADTSSGEFVESLLPNTNGVIVNGLMVTPVDNTLSLLVTSGIALMNAAGDSDDSVWRYVRDPGVTVAGVLAIAVGSGGVRIDVVEAQVVDQVLETSSRDVFDPTTGLFTATTVSKVACARLNYRVRAGSPSSGFPGLVDGWLPLCAISVPSSATTLNDCTLWDLRTLWKDIADVFKNTRDISRRRRFSHYVGERFTFPTTCELIGHTDEATEAYNCQGYVADAGAKIDLWLPATDPKSIWASGLVSFTNKRPWYVWACYPALIRNWRKYTAYGSGTRKPYGHPGVLALSQTPPNWQGQPTLLIPVPDNTGLYVGTTHAEVVACGLTNQPDGGSVPLPAASGADGDWVYPHRVEPSSLRNTMESISAFSAGTSYVDTSIYVITDNVQHPANARALRVMVERMFSYTGTITQLSAYCRVYLLDTSGGGFGDQYFEYRNLIDTQLEYSSLIRQRIHLDIPLIPYSFDPSLPTQTRMVVINWDGNTNCSGSLTYVAELLDIQAWRMTP